MFKVNKCLVISLNRVDLAIIMFDDYAIEGYILQLESSGIC